MRRGSLLVCVLVLLGCSEEKKPPAGTAAKPTQAGPVAKPVVRPPAPPPETPVQAMLRQRTLEEAIDHARAMMSDTIDRPSDGAILLAVWAIKRMKWAEVAVEKNETSTSLVKKDVDEARGKRMCAAGTIMEIEKQDLGEGGKLYEGSLMTDRQDILHFLAVGSTGELVQRSRARFCGVVIGRYDYANVSGGQTRSVAMVGMFDLPENTGEAGK